MSLEDAVFPFQVADSGVRGRVVRLSSVVDDILSAHDFPDNVSMLLGEALCLTALAGAGLKFDGKLIFQAQGDGPVSMLVADYQSNGALRAMAKIERPSAAPGAGLLGKGHVAMTLDQGPDMERYQGVTALQGADLAEIAVGYFDQSEQIPTVIRLAVGRLSIPGQADRWRAGGVMAQFVPGEGGLRERGEKAIITEEERDQWERAAAFVQSTQDDELLDPDISADRLLYRLFHEDGVRVFDPKPVTASCGCTGEKIAAVLERYSEDALSEMGEDGVISVTCEFCRTHYRFDLQGRLIEAS